MGFFLPWYVFHFVNFLIFRLLLDFMVSRMRYSNKPMVTRPFAFSLTRKFHRSKLKFSKTMEISWYSAVQLDLTIFLWSNVKLLESVWVEFLHILHHQLLNMLFLQSWLWPKTSKNLTNWPKQPISQLEDSNACYLRTKVKFTTFFHEFSE